jgi:hypothetical protein
LRGIDT